MGVSPQTPGLAALELGSINSLFDLGLFIYHGGQPPYPQACSALLVSIGIQACFLLKSLIVLKEIL
jgi:hypothetical protein